MIIMVDYYLKVNILMEKKGKEYNYNGKLIYEGEYLNGKRWNGKGKEISAPFLYDEDSFESHVLYKFEEEKPFEITKEDDVWVIKGEKVEKILKMTKFQTDESVLRFANKLRKLGIDDKLRELGAEDGDTVRILDFEFEFRE